MVKENAGKIKPVRKKNPKQVHLDGECGCSIESNPNNCIYQQFIDGWSFISDVGNGQNRGEVFTPRFIVDKMITDVEMFPKHAVYNFDYTDESQDRMKIITNTIVEPAAGTSNFMSTILWHKIEYAYRESLSGEKLDINKYHKLLLTAVASVYTFDIDCGNIEVTKRRLLSGGSDIYNNTTVDFWTNYIIDSLCGDEVDTNIVRTLADASLKVAQDNWGNFLTDGGVISKLYNKHVGGEIPEWLVGECASIMNHNIKLFNGIQENNTISDGLVVAGWGNIKWRFWDVKDVVGENVSISYELVSLAEQIITGEIEQLSNKAENLKESKMKKSDGSLFAIPTWEDAKSEADYKKTLKEIEKLKKKLHMITI